jgi:hypothetical protein
MFDFVYPIEIFSVYFLNRNLTGTGFQPDFDEPEFDRNRNLTGILNRNLQRFITPPSITRTMRCRQRTIRVTRNQMVSLPRVIEPESLTAQMTQLSIIPNLFSPCFIRTGILT